MNSSFQSGPKKAVVGIGTVLLLAASLLTVSTIAGAQGGIFASCPDDSVSFGSEGEYFGIDDYENHLVSYGPTSQTAEFALAAGTYDIGAVSTDGYEFRAETSDQPNEQWFAEFLAADGSVLATTGLTGDIETGVQQGFWSGSVGEVTLAADAASVRVVHAAIDAVSPNSVRAVCVGVLSQLDEPTIEPEVNGETEEREVVDPSDDSGVVPVIDPTLESSISVNYDSNNIEPELVTLLCSDVDGINTYVDGIGTGPDIASAVDLVQDPVSAGSECTITFPSMTDHDCTMTVTPEGLDELVVVEGDDNKVITFPALFEVDVFVDIYCDGPISTQVLGEVEVAPDPVAQDPVTAEVLAEVVTAPVAQVTDANPTFTG